MYHIFKHFKHFRQNNHFMYRFAMVVFLYSIVNGMVGFILPVFLEESINSLTLVGIILASSSIWNILTDFILGFLKKPPTYRFLMQLVGMSTFALFGMLWLSVSPLTLILATILWGTFTELFTFANFDYIVSSSDDTDRAANFGLITNFKALGFALAPIIIDTVIVQSRQMTLFYGIFFTLCFAILFNLQIKGNRLPEPKQINRRRQKVIQEIIMWCKIGKKISPLLIVYLVRGIADGVLTSFVPIFVEMQSSLKYYGGFIVAGLSLPTAFISGYFGHLADKKGRKIFILVGLVIVCLALLFFGSITQPLISFGLSLLIGLGYSLYVPPLEAEMSMYVEKHHNQESEVEGESGVFYNIGFIVGAAMTGILISIFHGFGPAFAVLGGLHFMAFVFFWFLGPKRQSLRDGVIG